jgi:hypothetical protein
MEVKAMRRKELEDRITRKRKAEGDDDARMDKLEALCAAQDQRLKKVEDMLTELHATMARAAPPPFVKPAAPKQKGTKKLTELHDVATRAAPPPLVEQAAPKQKGTKKPVGRAQPKRGSNRSGIEVLELDDPEDDCTLLEPARKDATETQESPDDCTETGDAADAPPAQEEAPDARTKPEEAVDAPKEPDDGAATAMETEEAFNAAIQTAGEGPEEDARTEEVQQEDVETAKSATPNDVVSPPLVSDDSDVPKAPAGEKVSSEAPDEEEEEVVETIATLSTEKKVSDQVC